ncbi:MAG: lactate dehydrogenase-like oxidoreductase [Verrucomicrobiales bacterium]|nr:lactate dehydrogenase-like oxidoreductase [Verrucomicrobiales bacterium]
MKTAVFSTKPYDREFLQAGAGAAGHELVFVENRLREETVPLAAGCAAVCAFVNDVLDGPVLRALHEAGTRFIAMRCAGYNNVDLAVVRELGLRVARVPAYSPYAVAEHTVALLLALNRHVPRANARVRDGNFSIDGLIGTDVHGKTVGVIGTGTIGRIFAEIMLGFGCRVIAHDVTPDAALQARGVEYLPVDDVLQQSFFLSLHCPLLPATRHLLDAVAFAKLPPGALVVNTSRGALIDAEAAVGAIKSGHLGGLALDVYEEEAELFFDDHSSHIIQDDTFMRLVSFPNVLVTSHQAFFTKEAMRNIAATTLGNLTDFAEGRVGANEVR